MAEYLNIPVEITNSGDFFEMSYLGSLLFLLAGVLSVCRFFSFVVWLIIGQIMIFKI